MSKIDKLRNDFIEHREIRRKLKSDNFDLV
jgi:hypothetical protein